MRTVAANWSEFVAAAKLTRAPDDTLRLMRIAFYAGANATLGIVHECGESDLSDEAGAAILTGMVDECRRFSREVTA